MTATRLVARSDDSQLAYAHGGRLGLLDPALRELATIERPGPPRWLGFVGAQLALLDGDELIALDLPSLAEGARVALPPGLGALAVVGDRVALGGAGLTVVVARLLGRKIDLSDFTMTARPSSSSKTTWVCGAHGWRRGTIRRLPLMPRWQRS